MTTDSIAVTKVEKGAKRLKIAMYEPYVFDNLYGNARYAAMYYRFIDKTQFNPVLISPIESASLDVFGKRDEDWAVVPGPKRLVEFGGKTLAAGPISKAYTLMCVFWYTIRLGFYFLRENVDIVQCHHVRAMLTAGFAAKLLGRPLVWYIKGELEHPRLDRICFMLADRVLFQGETNMRRRYPDLVEKYRHKIGISENGVDLDEMAEAENRNHDALKRELEIDPDKTNIVFVGQVVRTKGLDELVEAMAEVQTKFPDTALYIVGDHCAEVHMDYRHELEDAIRRHGLKNVRLTGWRGDAYDIISIMDIFVLPSHAEGVPHTIIEAMALGTPVLTTDVGSIADIVDHENTGLMAPAKDSKALARSLSRLVADPDLRDRMVQNGREAVRRNWSIRDGIKGFEKLYQTLT